MLFQTIDSSKMKDTYVNMIEKNFSTMNFKMFVESYKKNYKPLSQKFYIEIERLETTEEDVNLKMIQQGKKKVKRQFAQSLDF